MRNTLIICIGLALSLLACVAESYEDAPDAGLVTKGLATSPDEANVGGGGECGLDPVEQERNCPGGGSGGGVCDRVGQACPPPPGRPHDAVCSYEQRPEGGCVCRCFVPGGPALSSDQAE